jgi:probable HAF family extracellular repeat protein
MSNQQTQSILVFRILVISVLVAHPLFGVPHDYEVIILGDLGGEDSYAYGINDSGQVVGESTTGDGYRHAFLWEDGMMTDIGVLGVQPKGLEISGATSISNLGEVVGYSWYNGPSGEWEHAFVWESSQMRDLGTLGGINSCATAINNRGQIVGYSTKSNGDRRAFLWNSGTMIDIGTLEGGATYAYSINDNGQVVGKSYTSNGYNAFIWSNGEMTNLGTIDNYGSVGNGINNLGQIVGCITSRPSYTRQRAVLWDGETITDLGYIDPNDPRSYSFAINERGQIVGFSLLRLGPSNPGHACLWENGEMIDLHNFFPPNVHATYAYNINNSGHIVGYAEIVIGTNRAFIMIPVIEANIVIDPDTINLTSKGKWITAFIWLPKGCDVADIDPNSVFLEGKIKPERLLLAEDEQVVIAKFDREEVQSILDIGEVELAISGQLTNGTIFEARDTIRVIDKGRGKKSL